jgi:hypothetical protein
MQIGMQVACMQMNINSRKSINALISFPIYMPSKMALMRATKEKQDDPGIAGHENEQ